MNTIDIKTLADAKINTCEKIYTHLNPGKSYVDYFNASRIDQTVLPRPKNLLTMPNLTEFPINVYDTHVYMSRKRKGSFYLDLEKRVKEFNKSKKVHEAIKEKNRNHRLHLKKTKPKRDLERMENKRQKEQKRIKKEAKVKETIK